MNRYDVQAEFQGAVTEKRATTRYLVVHHTAQNYAQETGLEALRALAAYQVNVRGYQGIGYHIALAAESQDGPLARYDLSDLNLQRSHVAGHNEEALGIACLADFGSDLPEERWTVALAEVLRDLKQRYPDAQIVGHGELLARTPGATSSTCPGTRWNEWKPDLLARLAGAPLPSITTGATLLGPTRALPRQCTAAILSDPHGDYSDFSVASVIVPAYFDLAQQVGLDPLIAIAQMILETGNLTSWWAQRPRRNPAGLGVTGETRTTDPHDEKRWALDTPGLWRFGLSFAGWAEESIPAHLGRLLAYTLPKEAPLTPKQNKMLTMALALRPLPDSLRGRAPDLNGLVGTWAVPGRRIVNGREVTYADSIVRVANEILAH